MSKFTKVSNKAKVKHKYISTNELESIQVLKKSYNRI